MKSIIEEGIKQGVSYEREQSKSIAQLHKEHKIYKINILVLKRGTYARIGVVENE